MENEDQSELLELDGGIFEIDEHLLDEEWIKQPRLYMQYAMQLVEAKQLVMERASKMDLTKAELDQAIRAHPAKYGIEKVTEKAVESAMLTSKTYGKALKSLNRAKRKVDALTAVINGLEHRKRALENLVTLHGQNYFSSPRASDESTRESMDSLRKQKIRNKRLS